MIVKLFVCCIFVCLCVRDGKSLLLQHQTTSFGRQVERTLTLNVDETLFFLLDN